MNLYKSPNEETVYEQRLKNQLHTLELLINSHWTWAQIMDQESATLHKEIVKALEQVSSQYQQLLQIILKLKPDKE